jgi:SAM-dependent methyltransferase
MSINKGGYPSFTNLLFAIPLSGRFLPPEIMFAFHSMAMPMNYNNIIQTVKGMPVADAREQFADAALKNNCKYIYFWDEDVACPPQTIPELIYKMEQDSSIAVCGGVYCLKRDPSEPLIFMGNGNGPYWNWKAGDFFECSGIGMGCTIVRVEALKDLKRPFFKTVYDYSKMLDFGIPALESWTEDLWFCKRISDTKKWKVYVDTSILCLHYDLNSGRAFSLPPDSKPFQHISIPKGSKKILDIGSMLCENGYYQTSECANTIKVDYDSKEAFASDYKCDLTKLPFGNDEFDVVFSPALEYFKPIKTESVLKEWKRVLKPGGELRLVVENLETIIFAISFKEETDISRLFYGNTNKVRSNGFTKDSLKLLLELADFPRENIEFVPSDVNHIGIRAKK